MERFLLTDEGVSMDARFALSDLNPVESALVAHSAEGTVLDIRDQPATTRLVRARVIEQLLTDPASLGAESVNGVRIRGAKILGRVNLGGRSLMAPLELRDCVLERELILTKATASNISLRGTRMPGLKAGFLRCSGTLNIGSGFRSDGQVRLFGADLAQLEGSGATFNNGSGYALNASYLRVRGFASLENAIADGTLMLLGALIDGQLDMSGIRVSPKGGHDSINLDSATVTGGVILKSSVLNGGLWLVGLKAEGEIALQNSAITSDLTAIDASFTRIRAFDFSGSKIRGKIKIASAELTVLDGTDAEIESANGVSLDLDSSTISGAFHAQFASIDGLLDLTNTSVGVYRDLRRSWPPAARLVGATYRKIESDIEGLDGDRTSVSERLQWLELDDVYHPHAYTVLADAFRAVGKERSARKVAIAGERRRWSTKGAGARTFFAAAWGRAASWLLRMLVGYGYDPRRAIVWLIALIGIGTYVTQLMFDAGLIVATRSLRSEFVAPRYAIDLLFPVAGLTDADGFTAYGPAAWVAFVLTLLGWFFGIAVVTAIAAVLRRR